MYIFSPCLHYYLFATEYNSVKKKILKNILRKNCILAGDFVIAFCMRVFRALWSYYFLTIWGPCCYYAALALNRLVIRLLLQGTGNLGSVLNTPRLDLISETPFLSECCYHTRDQILLKITEQNKNCSCIKEWKLGLPKYWRRDDLMGLYCSQTKVQVISVPWILPYYWFSYLCSKTAASTRDPLWTLLTVTVKESLFQEFWKANKRQSVSITSFFWSFTITPLNLL